MEKRSLKDFFPDALGFKEEEIITVEAPEGYTDKKGARMLLEFRVLDTETTESLRKKYTTRTPVKDKRGGYIQSGRGVLMDEVTDNDMFTRHMIAESMVFPDLRDPELQAAYNCYDYVQMVGKLFPKSSAYLDLVRSFNKVQGFVGEDEDETEENESLIEEAKN